MIVTISGRQESLEVTSNLMLALDHMDKLGIRRVWVDSLCINQYDVEERSLQVRIMHLIYSKADEVVVYVGEAEKGEAEIVKAILRRTSLINGQNTAAREQKLFKLNSRDWTALRNFFNQDYWARVWIIQEVAVARRVIVFYGGVTLPCHDVEQFSKCSTEKFKRIVFPTDGGPSLIHVLQVCGLEVSVR
jgi:Heterokaryon incompatibility protein (HET)